MKDNDPGGHGRLSRAHVRRPLQRRKLAPEPAQISEVRKQDGDERGDPEMREDFLQAPAPFRGDHDDGRGGEMRQGAADGDVHKQESQSGVTQWLGGFQAVELGRKQHRPDRHRRRFSDERPE